VRRRKEKRGDPNRGSRSSSSRREDLILYTSSTRDPRHTCSPESGAWPGPLGRGSKAKPEKEAIGTLVPARGASASDRTGTS
jgi:hypothetical protein